MKNIWKNQDMDGPGETLAAPAEVMRRLRVSRRTLRRWTLDGKLPEVRLGSRCVRYRRSDIERLLQDAGV